MPLLVARLHGRQESYPSAPTSEGTITLPCVARSKAKPCNCTSLRVALLPLAHARRTSPHVHQQGCLSAKMELDDFSAAVARAQLPTY
eukprot:scaffold431_cov334-Pavlova_lutheri.AAC.3